MLKGRFYKGKNLIVFLLVGIMLLCNLGVVAFAVDENSVGNEGTQPAQGENNGAEYEPGVGQQTDQPQNQNNADNTVIQNEETADTSKNLHKGNHDKKKNYAVDLKSGSAVLYCMNMGEVLFSKNKNVKVNPMGTTHILNILVAMQNSPRLTSQLTADGEVAEATDPKMGIEPGSKFSLQELMYASVVLGANDAIHVIAQGTSSGNKDSGFDAKIKETLRNLGCKETVMSDLYGHDSDIEKNHTTADDMLKIFKVAWSDSNIKKMLKAKKFSLKGKDDDNKEKVKTVARSEEDKWMFDEKRGLIGGIIGKTSEKDASCISIYEKEGLSMVAIIYGGRTDTIKSDVNKLFDYGKKHVKGIKVIKKGEILGKARIKHGEKTRIKGYAERDGMAFLPKQGSKSLVDKKIKMKENLKAPIKRGQVIGTAGIYVAGDKMNEIPILSREDIGVGWFPSYVGISNAQSIIMVAVVAGLLFLFVTRRINIARSRRHRKQIMKRKAEKIALLELEREQEERRRGFWT